jgi:hypothetical protein
MSAVFRGVAYGPPSIDVPTRGECIAGNLSVRDLPLLAAAISHLPKVAVAEALRLGSIQPSHVTDKGWS